MKPVHFIGILLGVLILYPLSYGPAEWVHYHHNMHGLLKAMRIVYAPLMWVANEFTWVGDMLLWYEKLWVFGIRS